MDTNVICNLRMHSARQRKLTGSAPPAAGKPRGVFFAQFDVHGEAAHSAAARCTPLDNSGRHTDNTGCRCWSCLVTAVVSWECST